MELKVLIALLAVGGLVIGINVVLILWLRGGTNGRGGTIQHIRLWQKAAGRARNPWEQEEKDLKELSRLVGELKSPEPDQGDAPR